MNFFEHQDRARRTTGRLVVLFALGLVLTLLFVNILVFGLFCAWEIYVSNRPLNVSALWQEWLNSNLNWQLSVGVVVSVAIGTLFRFMELAGNPGEKIAKWARATPVDRSSRDSLVSRFVAVSEEMAIAAGMPMPKLYVMKYERGINAFVAGKEVDDAIMVVTQGALEALDRDELQAVVGHEYSHILNGDMRLNIRLIGWLGGLVLLGQMGRVVMETGFHSTGSTSRNNKEGAAVGLFIVAAGLVLWVGGSAGVLAGRMIRAAVSRQREFLADASSVQFTRNPDGLAGALDKIRQGAEGARLHHGHAEDLSHFCFGEAVAKRQWFATHPPLDERITRVAPGFKATRRRAPQPSMQVPTTEPEGISAFTGGAAMSGLAPTAQLSGEAVGFTDASVGHVSADHVEYAESLYRFIPDTVKEAVHEPEGARALLYSLIIADSKQPQQVLDAVKQADTAVFKHLQALYQFLQSGSQAVRLPLLEMALATLQDISAAERLTILARLQALVKIDGEEAYLEWLVLALVEARWSGEPTKSRPRGSLRDFDTEVNALWLLFVALSGEEKRAMAVYESACQQHSMFASLAASETYTRQQARAALNQLRGMSFKARGQVLRVCADIVAADGALKVPEFEAMRLVADALQIPLPPLVLPREVDSWSPQAAS